MATIFGCFLSLVGRQWLSWGQEGLDLLQAGELGGQDDPYTC